MIYVLREVALSKEIQKTMITLFDKVEIQKIEFQTSCNEVSVICVVTKGNLSYTNEIILNFSDLNRLINKIQKITKIGDLFSYFKSTKLEDGEDLYYLTNQQNTEIELPLAEMDDFKPLRQIRA
jgi:hypothetical protein